MNRVPLSREWGEIIPNASLLPNVIPRASALYRYRQWFIDPSQHEGEWPLGQGTEAHISASCIISRMVLNGLMYQHRIKYFLLLSRR